MSGIYQLPPRDNQEAFDRVWQRFVVEQAPKAATKANGDACMYRVGKDHGCAIGVQLPDALYHGLLEGASAGNLLGLKEPGMRLSRLPDLEGRLRAIRVHFANVTPALLQGLQLAHDNSSSPVGIERELRKVAGDWKLSIPVAA